MDSLSHIKRQTTIRTQIKPTQAYGEHTCYTLQGTCLTSKCSEQEYQDTVYTEQGILHWKIDFSVLSGGQIYNSLNNLWPAEFPVTLRFHDIDTSINILISNQPIMNIEMTKNKLKDIFPSYFPVSYCPWFLHPIWAFCLFVAFV